MHAQALTEVCRLAGVNLLGVMPETTAAAAAYSLMEERTRSHQVLVYDMGGGTLEVYVGCVCEQRFHMLDCKSALQLGGADIDDALVAHICSRIE